MCQWSEPYMNDSIQSFNCQLVNLIESFRNNGLDVSIFALTYILDFFLVVGVEYP